ncbi:MAG: hypothetical protein ACFFC7_24285 [Candidatus Hermodarchaeota archaeon]
MSSISLIIVLGVGILCFLMLLLIIFLIFWGAKQTTEFVASTIELLNWNFSSLQVEASKGGLFDPPHIQAYSRDPNHFLQKIDIKRVVRHVGKVTIPELKLTTIIRRNTATLPFSVTIKPKGLFNNPAHKLNINIPRVELLRFFPANPDLLMNYFQQDNFELLSSIAHIKSLRECQFTTFNGTRSFYYTAVFHKDSLNQALDLIRSFLQLESINRSRDDTNLNW